MTNEDDFLHALHESLEDDDLRLIFADWLDDHGDPRGELMRVQVLLGQLPADDPMRPELQQCEHTMLAEEEPSWLTPLCGVINGWSAHRGLLVINADGSHLLRGEFTEEERRLLRWVSVLHLHLQPRDARRLPSLSFLENLTDLDLGNNNLQDPAVLTLSRLPFMNRLESLNLRGNNLGPAAAAALGGSPHLSRLTRLELGHNRIGGSSHYLLRSPHLSRLTWIGLADNLLALYALGDDETDFLPGLTGLDLGSNALGDGIGHIVLSPLAHRLTALNLSRNGIGDNGFQDIADAPRLAGLTFLNLNGNNITVNRAGYLADSPTLRRLTSLHLGSCGLSNQGTIELADSPILEPVVTFNLENNAVYHETAALALVRSPYLERIVSLNLAHNTISATAQAALRKRFGDRVHF
jgi:uncharacterized protein (TIGR02996 family)